jgi:glutamine synthetase
MSDLATRADQSGTKFILALFVDLRGKPCAKLVPVEAVDLLATEGVGFAGYAVGAMGQAPKDPDLIAIPDPTSFTPIPFVKDGLAIVHCDPHVEGRPWHYAPRVILKALIERAADAGFEAWVGAEVEYFLLRRSADGSLSVADAADTAAQPCYDARGLTRMFDHLSAISTAMNTLGWSNYANDHEDGNGQFEQNFQFADALTTADRVVTLRYLLSMFASERGMVATFMPKPFAEKTGSGLHLHLSLTTGDTPVFPADEDLRGLGLSETAYAFIGGILEHANALQAVLAPTVNSFKRTGATTTASGASWAPSMPTFGGNDRTHYIRVPDAARIELRGSDGSANPYLAIAVALGAGMDGIKRSADPGTIGAQSRPPLPPTLLHAVDEFQNDPVITGVLDAAGAGVSSYFADAKRKEFFAYHSTVTPWEIDHYLTAF